jgi:hypothetical protein
MTTPDTTEFSLRTAVFPFGMPTGIAPLARVGWINDKDLDSSPTCFIGDECPQLAECPIVVSCSLYWPVNPCLLADMGQVG